MHVLWPVEKRRDDEIEKKTYSSIMMKDGLKSTTSGLARQHPKNSHFNSRLFNNYLCKILTTSEERRKAP